MHTRRKQSQEMFVYNRFMDGLCHREYAMSSEWKSRKTNFNRQRSTNKILDPIDINTEFLQFYTRWNNIVRRNNNDNINRLVVVDTTVSSWTTNM
jgi:hypothetical protein